MVKKSAKSKTSKKTTSASSSSTVDETATATMAPAKTTTKKVASKKASATKKTASKKTASKKASATKKSTSSKKSTSTKKTASKKASSKSATPAVSTPATTASAAPPVPPATSGTSTNTETTVLETITNSFDEAMARINASFANMVVQVENQIKADRTLLVDLKRSQKAISRELRDLRRDSEKVVKKNRKKSGKRKPSGFAKPGSISDELCQFLNVPIGTELARTAVTKMLTEYIKTNNLQNPDNKKEIIRDAALKKIITVEPGKKLTYFNLQKYMKHHYTKPTSSASSSVSVTV